MKKIILASAAFLAIAGAPAFAENANNDLNARDRSELLATQQGRIVAPAYTGSIRYGQPAVIYGAGQQPVAYDATLDGREREASSVN